MDELAKVRRIVDKRLPESEPETLFVLDATTGQNGLSQATAFHQAVGLTGIVLTKLDSTAKGGIVFAIEDSLRVPVRFVGVGEGVGDLIPFDPRVRRGALRLTAADPTNLTRWRAPRSVASLIEPRGTPSDARLRDVLAIHCRPPASPESAHHPAARRRTAINSGPTGH